MHFVAILSPSVNYDLLRALLFVCFHSIVSICAHESRSAHLRDETEVKKISTQI